MFQHLHNYQIQFNFSEFKFICVWLKLIYDLVVKFHLIFVHVCVWVKSIFFGWNRFAICLDKYDKATIRVQFDFYYFMCNKNITWIKPGALLMEWNIINRCFFWGNCLWWSSIKLVHLIFPSNILQLKSFKNQSLANILWRFKKHFKTKACWA